MFPTFSGSSRRPRNVNLSGQKNQNPFAATSWTPSSTGGASKTVADAQAERKQRQQERERLKAAQRIQRTWRGHKARRGVRDIRRDEFDGLYSPDSMLEEDERLDQGLPLALAIFQPSRPDDYDRLAAVTRDLLHTDFRPFRSDKSKAGTTTRFIRTLLSALDRNDPSCADETTEVFLNGLLEVVRLQPSSVEPLLDRYYTVLARYSKNASRSEQTEVFLETAIGTPLSSTTTTGNLRSRAYRAFVFSYLTQPNLSWFEQSSPKLLEQLDIDEISSVILEIADAKSMSDEKQLWLLAHFIAVQRARRETLLHSLYLRALLMQLTQLSSQIRASSSSRPAQSVSATVEGSGPDLPPYISQQLASLVDRDEVSNLLGKFTSNHGDSSAADIEDASLLAAYVLTLIRCFPAKGDDIRMRLYLADISTKSGRLPAVKFFWNAVSRASLFSSITASEDAALDILKHRTSQTGSSNGNGVSIWDRDWRTILLFLELYTFVLRLADDDDFFGGLSSISDISSQPSRLRQSGLSLEELRRLTLFLKHLCFTLYYNAAELEREIIGSAQSLTSIEDFLAPRSNKPAPAEPSKALAEFSIVPGIDLGAFKTLVSSAMHMLYERDSRRRFLPDGHWLMTSKFDMEGFLGAVVLEEQRQHELRENGDDDDEDAAENYPEDDEMDLDGPRIFSSAAQRRSRYAQVERLREQQKRAARQRLLAAVGPKLEILRNMPFVIPFDTRVQIFRQFVHLDKKRRRGGHIDADRWRMSIMQNEGGFDPERGISARGRDILARHHAEIKRGQVFEDALNEFYELGDGLKEPIQITFVDQFGQVEAGIDGGGVTKEFLTSVTNEAFTNDDTLFVTNDKNAYYPNPAALDQRVDYMRRVHVDEKSEAWRDSIQDLMRQYEFLGRIIGKCMYEGILIDISFAGFFLLKWAASSKAGDSGYRANINDLREMDEELYQGMVTLKNYPGDVSELALDFTINDQVSLPGEPIRTVTRNLLPNGEDVPVTNENRPLYINYVARHRLVAQPYTQTKAFLRGLGAIIDPTWLSMFNQSELQRLVGGDSTEIDVEDLRRNTVYSGVYSVGDDGEEHPTVQLFWEVMHTLSDAERRDVLKYVTSTPRAPLLGFSQLSPHFSIRDGGGDEERLPSASTCVNLLKLPRYNTAETLRNKLLYAVSSGAGFDLS